MFLAPLAFYVLLGSAAPRGSDQQQRPQCVPAGKPEGILKTDEILLFARIEEKSTSKLAVLGRTMEQDT